MKKFSISVLLFTAFFSVATWAGFTQPAPVTIDFTETGGVAAGDMLSARNSKNDLEFIGCGVRYFDTLNGSGGEADIFTIGFCAAQLEEGGNVTCFTQNKGLIDGMRLSSDSTYYTFTWVDDGAGNLTCTRIGTSVQSFYLPKGKANKVED